MLRFAHPEYLWALAGLPVLALFFFLVHRNRGRLLSRFVVDSLVPQLAPDISRAKRVVKESLLLLALAFLIFAAANPQVGSRIEEVKREGIDLFVALDVSLSMKAEDIRPNRLEKAKRDVSALLRKLRGDRVGLIVFAGDAFVQFPLTADYSAADLFISAVDVDAVPTPGTLIGSAISMALRSFPEDLPTQKAIIVVSDGENTEGDILGPVDEAKKRGVRIYTVGMGTPEGGPIPIFSPRGERTDYKRDRSGSIVLTKLDETTLHQIAVATGGSYRRATSGGSEIDEIFSELSSLEKTETATLQVTGFEDQFTYPLALAVLLLILELSISERRGKIFARLARLAPAGMLAPVFILALASAHAQTVRSHVSRGNDLYEKARYADAEAEYMKALEKNPVSREARFNLGNAYYRQERFEEGQRTYNASIADAPDATSRAMAYHNLGNTLFRAGRIQESIEAYKQALRLNPTDDDTRYNYQFARDKLKQQQDQKQQGKDDQQQDGREQKQQRQSDDRQQHSQDQRQPGPQQAQQDRLSQQQSQAQQRQQMSKDQAERILEALRNNEKEVQKQLRKREGVRVRTEKDW